jgi:predicted nucleic acid-binding protein
MTGLVFVDTNVVLYLVDARDLQKQCAAREWLDRLWRDRTGRTSVQVLNEFYYNATRKLRPGLPEREAWDIVSGFREWDPQPVTLEVLDLAHQVSSISPLNWWDALIVAAARIQGCTTLLTEDLAHDSILAGVRVCNPFVLSVQEARAGYVATSLVPPPRRGRGRPRLTPARAVGDTPAR